LVFWHKVVIFASKQIGMYPRNILTQIEVQLSNPEIILLFGARRTGKSTLLKLLKERHPELEIFSCDNPFVSDILQSKNVKRIKGLFETGKLVAFDEAQLIPDIGLVLKLMHDTSSPEIKILATGSSSFDLANKTGEPLTGRNISYNLYPLSLSEIIKKNGRLSTVENLNNYLIFGTYPGFIDMSDKEKQLRLLRLSGDYMFKDIFKFERLRNPEVLRKLLKALALQVGSQVSVQELAQLLRVSAVTIERYLDLLEKSFIIFKMTSYSNNLRNEIKKSKKYYFYDNGIRNALINNFNAIADRPDTGALWENFCVSEFLKKVEYEERFSNIYFWRTYDGAEIDLVEERNGTLAAYEFKWKLKRKAKLPDSFAKKYNVNELKTITPENIYDLIDDRIINSL